MRPSLRLSANPTPSSSSILKQAAKPSRLAAKKPPPASLEHFIQRSRALHLYRTILRSLYRIPANTRAEPVAYARGEFHRNRNVTDLSQIRYLISTGKTEFEGMQRYVDEMASRGKR